jgi:hypothetical protein
MSAIITGVRLTFIANNFLRLLSPKPAITAEYNGPFSNGWDEG